MSDLKLSGCTATFFFPAASYQYHSPIMQPLVIKLKNLLYFPLYLVTRCFLYWQSNIHLLLVPISSFSLSPLFAAKKSSFPLLPSPLFSPFRPLSAILLFSVRNEYMDDFLIPNFCALFR